MGDERSPVAAARDLLARGEASQAARILKSATGRDTGRDPAATLVLAEALIVDGRDAEAIPLVDAIRSTRDLDPEMRATVLALAAHVRTVEGDVSEGRRLAQQALGLARPASHAAFWAYLSLSRLSLFAGELAAAADAARQATLAAAGVTRGALEEATFHEALVLMQCDRFDRAMALIAALPQLDEEAPLRWHVLRKHADAAIRFHRGLWRDAVVGLDPRSPATDAAVLGDVSWSTSAGLLAVLLVHSDRLDEAADLLAAATHTLATGRRPMLLWGALLLAEARGQESSLRSLADRLLASIESLRSPVRLRLFGPDLVRVLLAMGDRDLAARIVDDLDAIAGKARVTGVTAAAQVCRGLLESDAVLLRAAAEGFARVGRPLEEASALEALARASSGSDPETTRQAGRAALRRYQEIGAERDERRLASWLRADGIATGRPGQRASQTVGWGALSPSERTVAGLIAEGLTNAEIGGVLAISVRTVETHVSHVLNKLSLPGRAAIAAAAARQGALPRR